MTDSRSQQMTRAEHRDALTVAAGDVGYLRQVGDEHLALFRPGGGTLLVTFEALDTTRARVGGLPISTGMARKRSWATLDIMAEGRTWFRDDDLHDFFDALTDDGFFDDYDKVIFAGGGMGAYGAAAHSVAAPGSILFLMQPYATLDRDLTPWEHRFRSAWALPFRPRYGNAADMIDAAAQVFIVTDPTETADAMHASLFRGEHVTRLCATHAGSDIQARLESIGVVNRLLARAEDGALTPLRFAQLWRGRRQDPAWLTGLMRKVDRMDRPWLSAILAGHMVRMGAGQAARRRLNAALSRLAADGRKAPGNLEPTLARSGERTLLAGE